MSSYKAKILSIPIFRLYFPPPTAHKDLMIVPLGNPVQFHFGMKRKEILAIQDRPSMEAAFAVLSGRWEILAEEIYELKMEGEGDPDAQAEYILDLHTGQVKRRNLDWLREQFDSYELADLTMAIAQELYPETEWQMIESREGYIVVTDAHRSLVFDLKNYDKLSAAASLILAEDKEFQPTEAAQLEVHDHYTERIQVLDNALEIMKSHLAQDQAPAAPVLPFDGSKDRDR